MKSPYPAVGLAVLCAGAEGIAADADALRGELSGGVTATVLGAEGGRADPAAAASFDLVMVKPHAAGAWVMYVEGSTSVNDGTVSAVFPDANADAGTAAVNGSEGTVQVSELKYRWGVTEGAALSFGVLDATAYLDASGTANDENTQFLNVSLVNNPTIEFPDYTLGLVYEQALGETMHVIGLVSSSHGIADNPDHSYAQLFDVDDEGKGTFAVAALRFDAPLSIELGLWTSSADHATLDGVRADRSNHGAYAVAGAAYERMSFDLRAGYADPDVTEANVFASASLAYTAASATFGVGYARSNLAEDAKGAARDDSSVAEVYVRMPLGGIEATLDLQQLRNPGFDATVPDTRVGGVRLHYAF
jgi:hypothetical protein